MGEETEARRLPVRPALLRHRLHRPGEAAHPRRRDLDQRHGLRTRRHRQLRGGAARFGLAHLAGRGVRRRLLRRLLPGDPGRPEGIDLTLSRAAAGWNTPVTVSLAYGRPGSGHPRQEPPRTADELIGEPPAAGPNRPHRRRARRTGSPAAATARWSSPTSAGTRPAWSREVLGQLSLCHAFLPNDGEAMSYTRTETPAAALAPAGRPGAGGGHHLRRRRRARGGRHHGGVRVARACRSWTPPAPATSSAPSFVAATLRLATGRPAPVREPHRRPVGARPRRRACGARLVRDRPRGSRRDPDRRRATTTFCGSRRPGPAARRVGTPQTCRIIELRKTPTGGGAVPISARALRAGRHGHVGGPPRAATTSPRGTGGDSRS